MVHRRPQGELGLADFVAATRRLRPGAVSARQIAALLGFELRSEQPKQPTGPAEPTVAAAPVQPEPPTVLPDQQRDSAHREQQAVEQVPWQRQLTPVGREFATALARAAEPLEPDEGPHQVMDFLPLIKPRYTARVVQAAASTDTGDGDLDLDAAVEMLAARGPLARWPVESSLSMLRGVQLLIDAGESMTLFGRDCLSLSDAFRSTVGHHLVEEFTFSGTPWRGAGRGPRWTWGPYLPPAPATPVVALSDLNIPGRDLGGVDIDGWLRTHELLARRGCALMVFVPFPPSRWPAKLRGRLPLVQWDRTTSASAVLKAMSAGAR